MPPTPHHLKNARRESASVIDDFFGDKMPSNLGRAALRGVGAQGQGHVVPSRAVPAPLQGGAAGRMLNATEKKALFGDDNARRTSSSLVEEFFGLSSGSSGAVSSLVTGENQIPSAGHSLGEKIWVKEEPEDEEEEEDATFEDDVCDSSDPPAMVTFDSDPVDVFDVDSTICSSVILQPDQSNSAAADPLASYLTGAVAGTATTSSDSMWEDLTASMNMVDNNSMSCDTNTSTGSRRTTGCNQGLQHNVFHIKSEPMDCVEKPSCQYSTSLAASSNTITTTLENFLFPQHQMSNPFGVTSNMNCGTSSSSIGPNSVFTSSQAANPSSKMAFSHSRSIHNSNTSSNSYCKSQVNTLRHSASTSGGVVSLGSASHIHTSSPSTSSTSPLQYHQMSAPPTNFLSQPASAPHVVPNLFMPPTPPNSQPGSPSNSNSSSSNASLRLTPPPPYPGSKAFSNIITSTSPSCSSSSSSSNIISHHHHHHNSHNQPLHSYPHQLLNSASPSLPVTVAMVSSTTPTAGGSKSSKSERPRKQPITHPGCSTIKYNRKNNPELEKRRIHYCSFPGQYAR